MEKVTLVCQNNDKTKEVEVLQRSDKHLKVVFEGTTMTLDLRRTDVNKPYVGHKAGLEFTSSS